MALFVCSQAPEIALEMHTCQPRFAGQVTIFCNFLRDTPRGVDLCWAKTLRAAFTS